MKTETPKVLRPKINRTIKNKAEAQNYVDLDASSYNAFQ
jgi:hypothetical protein